MCNEVGSNDLGHETSLLNSSKTDHNTQGRDSEVFKLFQESEQNVGKSNLESILLTCPLAMLKVSAPLNLKI